MNYTSMLYGLELPYRILLIGLIPAVLTSIGSLPVIFGGRIGSRGLDTGLGFSAGVMLVASFTSLLLPAFETGRLIAVYTGFVAGIFLIYILDKTIPHLHIVKGYEGPKEFRERLKKTLLIVLAITIHNIPEGMSVGVSTITGVTSGLIVGTAIGLQDIPEGMAVSLPLYRATKSRSKSLLAGVFSGFSELVAAYIPLAIIYVFPELLTDLLPFLMSFSAGAMIYVVVHEIVPEIYGKGYDDAATLGFFMGFLVMISLDVLLG